MTVRLEPGDCLEVMARLKAEGVTIDAVVTDPPYHLTSIVKRFGAAGAAPAKEGRDGLYARASRGFMGQTWDGGDIAFRPETWRLAFDLMKPGAHLVAFSGTRTYHRMACAIEDAGFEIRDCLFWHYGSGFPKSHNISKKLDEQGAACACHKSSVYCPDDMEPKSVRDLRQSVDADDALSSGPQQNVRGDMQGHQDQPEQHSAEGSADNSLRDMRHPCPSAAKPRETERGDVLRPILSKQDICRSNPEALREHEGAQEGAAISREKPRMEGRGDAEAAEGKLQRRALCESPGMGEADGSERWVHHGASVSDGANVRVPSHANGSGQSRGSEPREQPSEKSDALPDERGSQAWGGWPVCGRCGKPRIPEGLGTALKPATEPIVLARKPIEGTIAANVLRRGTGALNIDACRIAGAKPDTTRGAGGQHGRYRPINAQGRILDDGLGRWPANILHDGSEEVLAAFPDSAGQLRALKGGENSGNDIYGKFGPKNALEPRNDSGSAARFFYSAKADKLDRWGSKHPTVKPVDLMRWLCRLITPPGGLILDPFAGSGSTGIAAMAEGFDAILIEREPAYVADIEARLAWYRGEGAHRSARLGRARNESRAEPLPLFAPSGPEEAA